MQLITFIVVKNKSLATEGSVLKNYYLNFILVENFFLVYHEFLFQPFLLPLLQID